MASPDPDHRPEPEPATNNGNEEGWTHVTRKGKGKGNGRRTGRLAHLPRPAVTSPPSRSVPTLTVDQIHEEHYRIAAQWRAKPSATALTELIASSLDSHVSSEIDRAVCLGNGSFGPPDGVRANIWRAHVQTEAFLSIIQTIEKHKGGKIDCFFQEPLYTEPDKAFLESLGHSVAVTPAAFELVTSTTLVFGIHLYRPDYCRLLAKAIPAMLIGNDQTCYGGFPEGIPDMEKLREMDEKLDKLDKLDFPTETGDHCFSTTCIYWQMKSLGEK